jgi:chromosome segregation ATPase
MNSTIQDLRAALARAEAEQDRMRSERTTLLLQLESCEREKQRLERQIEAVTTVLTSRRVDVSSSRGVA